MRISCAVLLLVATVFAGDPPPYPEHVGEAIGPHNHAHWPVRVRNLDQIRWTVREGKHAGMAAPIGGGIRGVEAGTGKRWWLSEGNTRFWNYSTCVMGPGGIAYGGNHDWIVFNVVANRLRWGGASYFGVHATAPNGEPAFVSTTEGGWFACDDPSEAAAFIARRGPGTETLARAPERPWHDAKARWHELLGREFPGRPVWGESPSTWIKYVVRAHD